MNCYELLRPDGAGTGIWACGECHKPHLVAWSARKPVSDMNQKAAEECCAPRDCRYCGQPTERGLFGQYKWAHDACVPKYEPEPPHPSMANPYARLLHEKMSAISEDCWCAGWMTGNEYALWGVLHGDDHTYGWCNVPYEDLEELRVLSEHAGGWIWTGPARTYVPQLVSFEVWKSILVKANEHLAEEIHLDLQDLKDLEG
jgi:hypothetical protein